MGFFGNTKDLPALEDGNPGNNRASQKGHHQELDKKTGLENHFPESELLQLGLLETSIS